MLMLMQKALNEDETLTPLGYHLAKLPLDPQTGKMIIMASIFSCLDPILTVAASLSFKDAFMVPLGKEKLVDKVKKQFAGDSKSDHIMLVNVFSQWEEAVKHRNGNDFCYANFLSWNTLKGETAGTVLMRCSTKTDAKTSLHPKSVNVGAAGFDTQWFVYYTKIRSTRTYLHDITPVYPIPLLLFGGFFRHSGDTITLDDWITIHCDYNLAKLVQDLRQEFDRILEKKITAPGLKAGTMSSNQRRLLAAIIQVLSQETTDVPEVPDSFDDDDTDVPGIDET
ncbi:hypothetical protein HPB52_003898 [Rhipicephalus sanguineus]|uniref:Helicase-associated domain-containing protein n=1 Tax=Rhipicephalus sanguineus TaxID=34632 RepID=A0A9D4SXI0_RHISA|nr:hypothetical protein HPB52_003898 [Rhipicephalus sanguineus]